MEPTVKQSAPTHNRISLVYIDIDVIKGRMEKRLNKFRKLRQSSIFDLPNAPVKSCERSN